MQPYYLSRWLNSVPGKREYRGPKLREEYIDLAQALLQLQVISQAEARQWLLSQGLYPLPHEAVIFSQVTVAPVPTTVADDALRVSARKMRVGCQSIPGFVAVCDTIAMQPLIAATKYLI